MSDHPPDAADASRTARRRRPRTPRLLIIGLAVGALLGTAGAVVATRAVASSDAGCDADVHPLRVLVAPELSYVVTSALQEAAARGAFCQQNAEIVPADPANTAKSLQAGVVPADVWIPDSGVWLTEVGDKLPRLTETPRPVATSPLVLAVPAAIAGSLGQGRPVTAGNLLPAAGREAGPVRWVLPSPDRSAATVGAVIALRSAVKGRPNANTVLSTVIRGSSPELTAAEDAAGTEHPLATPMSEQQAYAYNLDHPVAPLAGVYPAADEFVFDYPFTVLTGDADRRATAGALLTTLRDAESQRLLGDAGFRTDAGTSTNREAARDSRAFVHVPDAQQADASRDAYQAVLRPSRLLALIDVSGSMAKRVPGAGGATRLNLATQAAVNGLAVYPDDTAVGLWVFATDLTRTSDYRELAPVAPLGRGADGVSGRERVALGLARTAVAKGHWTGLYDSVLAAVREMRRTWDPDRVNSVVVITDGGNSDRHGVSLPQLLQTLQAENDPKRPVAVFSIAYGPGGDLSSLQRISAVVGGKAYAAPDPRMINEVLRDAVGRRACTSNC